MRDSDVQRMIAMLEKNILAGAQHMSGDGGYSEGTREGYEAFVKVREGALANSELVILRSGSVVANNKPTSESSNDSSTTT
jgi:hypothetical protein